MAHAAVKVDPLAVGSRGAVRPGAVRRGQAWRGREGRNQCGLNPPGVKTNDITATNSRSDITQYGQTIPYLTARIARDRPDILDRMKAGDHAVRSPFATQKAEILPDVLGGRFQPGSRLYEYELTATTCPFIID